MCEMRRTMGKLTGLGAVLMIFVAATVEAIPNPPFIICPGRSFMVFPRKTCTKSSTPTLDNDGCGTDGFCHTQDKGDGICCRKFPSRPIEPPFLFPTCPRGSITVFPRKTCTKSSTPTPGNDGCGTDGFCHPQDKGEAICCRKLLHFPIDPPFLFPTCPRGSIVAFPRKTCTKSSTPTRDNDGCGSGGFCHTQDKGNGICCEKFPHFPIEPPRIRSCPLFSEPLIPRKTCKPTPPSLARETCGRDAFCHTAGSDDGVCCRRREIPSFRRCPPMGIKLCWEHRNRCTSDADCGNSGDSGCCPGSCGRECRRYEDFPRRPSQ